MDSGLQWSFKLNDCTDNELEVEGFSVLIFVDEVSSKVFSTGLLFIGTNVVDLTGSISLFIGNVASFGTVLLT